MLKTFFKIILISLSTLLLSSCGEREGPTDEQILSAFNEYFQNNEAYNANLVSINSVVVEVNENVGSKVEPIYHAKYSIEASFIEDFYKLDKVLYGEAIIDLLGEKNDTLVINGIYKATANLDTYKFAFSKTTYSTEPVGLMVSDIEQASYAINGSDQANSLLEKLAQSELLLYCYSDNRRRNTQCGYLDDTGSWAIPPIYEMVGPFSDGVAAVKINRDAGWGYINKLGDWVIKPKYIKASSFHDGLAYVEVNRNKDLLIDTSGNVVFGKEGENIKVGQSFTGKNNTLVRRISMNGKYGLHSNGQWLVEPAYISMEYQSTSKGYFKVRTDAGYSIMDLAGDIIIPLQFDFISILYNGIGLVEKDNEFGLIDIDKGKVIWFKDKAWPLSRKNLFLTNSNRFIDGFFQGKIGKQSVFINKNGKLIVMKEGWRGIAWNSMIKVTLGNLRPEGYLNNEGDLAIPLTANYQFGKFMDGYVRVRKQYGERFSDVGVMDEKGNWVVKPRKIDNSVGGQGLKNLGHGRFQTADYISFRYNKYGMINVKGETLLEKSHGRLEVTKDGWITYYSLKSEDLHNVERDRGGLGFISPDGQVIKKKFNRIKRINENLIAVETYERKLEMLDNNRQSLYISNEQVDFDQISRVRSNGDFGDYMPVYSKSGFAVLNLKTGVIVLPSSSKASGLREYQKKQYQEAK